MPDTGAPPGLYVLAGGRSSRFGRDKARAPLDGGPMLLGVIERLRGRCDATAVVVDEPGRYADLGVREVVDRTPGAGPLGGLEASLTDRTERGGGWVLLAACDLVRPDPAWLDSLLPARGDQRAVAFAGDAWEPLLTLYHADLLPTVRERLACGRRSLHGLLDAVDAHRVALPDGLTGLPQANRPEDLPGHAPA